MIEWTSTFMPDAGKPPYSTTCLACGEKLDVKENVNGPTSWVQSMTKTKRLHDLYTCPHANEDWHLQVVELKKEAHKTPSARMEAYFLLEADQIIESKKASKIV